MDHNSVEYYWIFSKAHSKAPGTWPSFWFILVYMFMPVCMQLCVNVCVQGRVATREQSGMMEKRDGWEVGGGSQGGLEGLGVGWRVSGHWWFQWFGSLLGKFLKADTHNKYALVFWDFLCSNYYCSFWLKCTGSEDAVSQSGLSKIVNTVLRYFLFFLQKRFTTDMWKTKARKQEQEWQ